MYETSWYPFTHKFRLIYIDIMTRKSKVGYVHEVTYLIITSNG